MVNNNNNNNNNKPILFNDFMTTGHLEETHLEYTQTDRQTVKSSSKSLKKTINSRPGHEYFCAPSCPYWLCGPFYLLLRSHQDSPRKTD